MIKSEKAAYWKDRADRYSGFKWAKDPWYLFAFIGACDLNQSHIALDVGCGPGIVSKAIKPLVHRVIGMDNSKEMLAQCDGEINLMFGDISDIPFPDQMFDRLLARNVFHHMISDLKGGFSECHRVLKRGGKIIIGERVPPADECEAEYRDMLSLKDRRHTITEASLFYYLTQTGFGYQRSFYIWIKDFSVKDWLNNAGLDISIRNEIWLRHIHGSKEFKKACHMRITEDDCLIDLRNIITIGEKK